MTTPAAWLASRTIVAVKPNGEELTITLRVGIPFELSADEWACPLAMDGYQERLNPIDGIDAWQTIQLVFNFQHQSLGYLAQEGAKFFYQEPREPMELEELFPSRSAQQ